MLGFTYSYSYNPCVNDDVYLVRADSNGVSCEIILDTNYRFIDTLFRSPQYFVDSEFVYQGVHFNYDPRYDVDSLCYDTSHSHRMLFPFSSAEEFMALYPNPVNGVQVVTIHFESEREDEFRIEVNDQLGEKWYSFVEPTLSYQHEKQLNV